MREDSLLYFENPQELRKFIRSLDVYNGWKIQSGVMNDRGKMIIDKGYAIKLRKIFKDKQFFRKAASVAEIVSWMDNLILISRVLDNLEESLAPEVFAKFKISAEYKIKMSKKD